MTRENIEIGRRGFKLGHMEGRNSASMLFYHNTEPHRPRELAESVHGELRYFGGFLHRAIRSMDVSRTAAPLKDLRYREGNFGLTRLSEVSAGYSGAEIEEALNEASLKATYEMSRNWSEGDV